MLNLCLLWNSLGEFIMYYEIFISHTRPNAINYTNPNYLSWLNLRKTFADSLNAKVLVWEILESRQRKLLLQAEIYYNSFNPVIRKRFQNLGPKNYGRFFLMYTKTFYC